MACKEDLQIEHLNVGDLIPYVNNSRTHSTEQINQIISSIKEFGFCNPILIDEDNGIIAGHGRLLASNKMGLKQVPTIRLVGLTEAQKKAYVIADNSIALNSEWDLEKLNIEVEHLKEINFDIDLLALPDDLLELDSDIFGGGDKNPERAGNLSREFLVPPFSVLSAREGIWQERKNEWLSLGIKSEVGRDDELTFSKTCQSVEFYRKKEKFDEAQGRKTTWGEFMEANPELKTLATTSIFDPVLCEIAYRWFCFEGGVVLDPFAGGSVRGVVASKTNRQYIGHELREEQVKANREQAKELCGDDEYHPVWICGDSRNIDKTCKDVEADLVFTCPPYADLEVYSDDPNDLSTLSYEEFKTAYFEIIDKSCQRLKEDRFAFIVIGEVRDKKGNYYNFVGDTIQAFLNAGLKYYNEMILVTPVGSLPTRTGKQFKAGRKVGKTHQNVLVFVKGDGKKATKACGDVDFSLGEDDEDIDG